MTPLLETLEQKTKKAGLVTLLVTLVILLWGVWRGTKWPAGQQVGREPDVMRTPAFYFLATMGYFGVCYSMWRPFPWPRSPIARWAASGLGSLLFFTGLTLVAWGRVALGQMYNVSSSMGTQLFKDHQLVTHGPFALVRHPMYLGVMLAGAGGLLLYRTWTFVFVLLQFPVFIRRARLEERALAQEFGTEWESYRQKVPPFILWATAEKVGALNQQLDDPQFPQITYRRGASGLPEPSMRGTGIRVQTIVVAHQEWHMTAAQIAEEYSLTPRQVDEALAFYAAHQAEIEGLIAQEETLVNSNNG